MELKQSIIEQLVIDYFRQRPDIEVQLREDGLYLVHLMSASARQSFFGSDKILMTFDPVQATDLLDCELITSTHPILEIIRNELGADSTIDPRISEGHLMLQFIDEEGAVSIPKVNFHFSKQDIDAESIYYPYYIFTYQIVYDTDERSENILRLSYNGTNGKLQPDLLPILDTLQIVEGPPDQKKQSEKISLDQLLNQGQKVVEELVQTDLQIIGGQIANRLQSDRDRLRKHLDTELSELRSQNDPEYQQIEARFQKDIADLERKYTCSTKGRLLSVLKIWIPNVLYKVIFAGHHHQYNILGIRYDISTNKTEYNVCPKCGNHSEFDICLVGQHTTCAGKCAEDYSDCTVCNDPMCSAHGGPCAHCGLPVCQDDHQQCNYGKHKPNTYFCPNCTGTSFENKTLCTDCREICTTCQRPFAHEHIKVCRVGQEHVCTVEGADPCGNTCKECGNISCKEHGLKTVDQVWACKDHTDLSTCCDQVYGKSRLVSCVMDSREKLCPKPEHRGICLDCNTPVCMQHSHDLRYHPKNRVCDRCQIHCEFCSADVYYVKQDVAHCKTCKKNICTDHRVNCVVCNQPLCKDHAVLSASGEFLCKEHAGECVYCKPPKNIHRQSTLAVCGICQRPHCGNHDAICPICQRTHLCQTHIATLKTCASCGRGSCAVGGCSPALYTCPDCGNSYCQHCFQNGRCTVCNNLIKTQWQPISLEIFKWITGFKTKATPADQQSIETMLRYEPKDVSFKVLNNNSYSVYLMKCNPSLLNKFFNWDWAIANKQLRLVYPLKDYINVKLKIEDLHS